MYWNSKKKNWELKTPFSFLFFVISARGKISVVNDFSLFIFVSKNLIRGSVIHLYYKFKLHRKFNRRKCRENTNFFWKTKSEMGSFF